MAKHDRTNVIDMHSRAPRKEAKPEPHPIFKCSFVKRVPIPGMKRAKEWCYWAVEPTGGYCADYPRGAAIALEFMEAHGSQPSYGTFLISVYTDMAKADQRAHRGLITGFMNTLTRFSQINWSADLIRHARARVEADRVRDAELMAPFRTKAARTHRNKRGDV
jgi:hypothetical protein